MSPSPLASTDRALVQLANLASGLLFISESDHALRVVRLGAVMETELPSAICAQLSRIDAPMQCVELAAFFERATRSQPYHTAADRAVAERYRTLVRFLSHELANARVYRVGEIEVDVYALGQSLEGEWLGVATKLIET
ncbi:MAG TPA: nuclease A inhibitor family protein [Polyangiaceae bacterium]|nr:nuclease A inhibitor family protein [Polyangiaceae bacterium]